MDPLEREGMSDPDSHQVNDELTPIEPAKTGEPAQPAQAVTPAENADLLQSPMSDPGLEAQRLRMLQQEQKMIASNTRKTQGYRDEHVREMDALTAERQQIAAQMQQQTAAQQAAAQEQSAGPAGIASRFSPQLQATMSASPELQELVGHLDTQSSAQLESLREENTHLSGQLKEMQGAVQQQQIQATANQLRPQYEALQKKYGEALPQETLNQAVAKTYATGVGLEAALFDVAPQTVLSHQQAVANVAAETKMREQWGDPAALAGMDDEFSGEAPQETFQSGESMESTFLRRHGKQALNEALRDGFSG